MPTLFFYLLYKGCFTCLLRWYTHSILFVKIKCTMAKNILEIIDRVKKIKGVHDDDEVAAALEMSKGNLSNYKTRRAVPYESLSRFCVREAISLDWLLTGYGPMMRELKTEVTAEEIAQYGPGAFVFIPHVSGEISAGGGLIADNTIEMRIAFRRDWIERKGDPQNMSLIRVSGDSMEPTLISGDLVLIDHNRNFIDPQGGIYAIAAGNIIMIKRLQVNFLTSKIRVISDNLKYESAEVEQEKIRVNGKVIWYGREMER